jgi:hypothetical protein
MTRRTASRKQNREAALDAFIATRREIDRMLARLQALSDEHFNWTPGEITWSHAETLARHAARLKEISDAAFGEGEHAG